MRPAPNRLPIGRGRRIKSALKHVSRTSASLQKRPSKLRANLPRYRSYGDVGQKTPSSSTTKRTCLLLCRIKWLLVPRLGKAERLSPFPRRKNEGKNAEPKDHNAKDCKAKIVRKAQNQIQTQVWFWALGFYLDFVRGGFFEMERSRQHLVDLRSHFSSEFNS